MLQHRCDHFDQWLVAIDEGAIYPKLKLRRKCSKSLKKLNLKIEQNQFVSDQTKKCSEKQSKDNTNEYHRN